MVAYICAASILAYFPAIIWSSCAYGAQMMWLSLMGNTQTLFYASEPYNFTADKVGLTNLAPFVGVVLGMLYGGRFVDWFSLQKAKETLVSWNPSINYGL